MNALWLIVLYGGGRVASWALYQLSWNHAADGRAGRGPVLARLPGRPLAVVSLVLWLGLTWRLDWQAMAGLRPFAGMAVTVLALAAVGRTGPAEPRSPGWIERLLVLVLAAGAWLWPQWLYPSVLASCCVQYAAVAGWPLGPGYSNLLGFEFMRASAAGWCACFAVHDVLPADLRTPQAFVPLAMAAVLVFQSSAYFNQALAKSALGPTWWSWIRDNRVQCLVVNAWLRGWGGRRFSKSTVLRIAAWIGRHRATLCLAVWSIEVAWIALLCHRDVALFLLCATVLFHAVVFCLTGLLAWAYLVNHAVLIALILGGTIDAVFGAPQAWAAVAAVLVTAPCIAWIRLKIAEEIRAARGAQARWLRLGDAVDLWMAWWDSPYMRMHSFRVRTADGRSFALPVTCFSPHDTALTDIHTHIMHLGLHDALDPRIAADRRVVRSGVWGLLCDRAERDRLYTMMDGCAGRDLPLAAEHHHAPWMLRPGDEAPAPLAALAELAAGLQRAVARPFGRLLLLHPHFPGEDLVDDQCPLVEPALPRYRFEEPFTTLELWRVKTLQSRDDVRLLEQVLVGSIDVGDAADPPP